MEKSGAYTETRYQYMSYHADFCAKYVREDGSVLDVGSGRGAFVVEMARKGFQVFGVEVSPPYIREAQKKASDAHVSVSFSEASAEQLPFPDGQFDFVNAAEVTEHVDDPTQMCREIFRVLKPGSHAYLSFHNRWGIYDYHFHLWFINWMPRAWTDPILKFFNKQKDDSNIGRQKLTTMHYYRYEQVREIVSQIGFSVRDIREDKIRERFGSISIFPLFIYRMSRPWWFNTFHVLLNKSKNQ